MPLASGDRPSNPHLTSPKAPCPWDALTPSLLTSPPSPDPCALPCTPRPNRLNARPLSLCQRWTPLGPKACTGAQGDRHVPPRSQDCPPPSLLFPCTQLDPLRTSRCRPRYPVSLNPISPPPPSLGQPTPGVVKQDKSSGGSVDTTKTRSGPQRVRTSGGERPIGAAKGKQSDAEALCHPSPAPNRKTTEERRTSVGRGGAPRENATADGVITSGART